MSNEKKPNPNCPLCHGQGMIVKDEFQKNAPECHLCFPMDMEKENKKSAYPHLHDHIPIPKGGYIIVDPGLAESNPKLVKALQEMAELAYNNVPSPEPVNQEKMTELLSWLDAEIKFSLDNWVGRSKSHMHPRKVRATALETVKAKIKELNMPASQPSHVPDTNVGDIPQPIEGQVKDMRGREGKPSRRELLKYLGFYSSTAVPPDSLKEGDIAPGPGVRTIILSAFNWAIENNLQKVGPWWGKDTSIIAYSDEGVLEEFFKIFPISAPADKQNEEMPVEIKKWMDEEVDRYAFQVPYDGSKNFYDEKALKDWRAGSLSTWEKAKEYYQEEVDCLKSEIMGHKCVYVHTKEEIAALQAQLDMLHGKTFSLQVHAAMESQINTLTEEITALREGSQQWRDDCNIAKEQRDQGLTVQKELTEVILKLTTERDEYRKALELIEGDETKYDDLVKFGGIAKMKNAITIILNKYKTKD